MEYSPTLLYRNPLNPDTSILQTVLLVTKPYISTQFNLLKLTLSKYGHFLWPPWRQLTVEYSCNYQISHLRWKNLMLHQLMPFDRAYHGCLVQFFNISSNINKGRLFLCSLQKGQTIWGNAIIRGRRLFHILLTESRAINFCFIIPLDQKIITSNKLNMSFLSVPNFSLIYFQTLNRHWSVFLDKIPLQLDKGGIKEREDGKRGRGRIIWGRWLF